MGKHTNAEGYAAPEFTNHQPPQELKGLYEDLESAYDLAYRNGSAEPKLRGGRTPVEHVAIAHETATNIDTYVQALGHIAFLDQRLAATASSHLRHRGAHVVPMPEVKPPVKQKEPQDTTAHQLGFTL